jgi:hypothetical protein
MCLSGFPLQSIHIIPLLDNLRANFPVSKKAYFPLQKFSLYKTYIHGSDYISILLSRFSYCYIQIFSEDINLFYNMVIFFVCSHGSLPKLPKVLSRVSVTNARVWIGQSVY